MLKAKKGFFNNTSYFSAIRNMVISLASQKQNLSVVIQTKILGEQSVLHLEYKIYCFKMYLEYPLVHEHL